MPLKVERRQDRKRSPYYVVGTVRAPNGASHRVRESTGSDSKLAAEEWARAKEREVIKWLMGEAAPVSQTLSFGDALEGYLARPEPIHSFDVQRLEILAGHFGDWPAAKIDGAAFAVFTQKQLPKRAPATIGRWRSTLVAVLNHAAANHSGLVVNPIPSIAQRRPRPVFLSPKLAELLIEHYHPLLRSLAILLAFQGCRIGEALRLQWPQVDLDRRTVTFLETKNGEPRTVPLHLRSLTALKGINRPRVGPVFLTPAGVEYRDHSERGGTPIKRAHQAAIRRCIEQLIKDAGDDVAAIKQAREDAKRLGSFTVHNWRSHWASWMVMRAGAGAHQLMELGGWRSIASVRHYVALAPEHLRATLDRL